MPEDTPDTHETPSLPDDPSADDTAEDAQPELNYEHTSTNELKSAYHKLKAYRAGDNDAREDIQDIPRRARILSFLRPDIKRTAFETIIPFSLTVYAIFIAFFLLMMDPESTATLYLTSTNRIGDLFVADIALIGFFVFMFLAGPHIASRLKISLHPRARKLAIAALLLFQLIPVAVMTVFLGATFSGQDVAQRGYDIYLSTIAQLKPQAPDSLVNLGEWYYSLSPIGVSAKSILAVMFFAGVLYAIPYLIRLGKAAAYVIASDPDDFPDIEIDEAELYEDPDPRDAAEFTPKSRENATTTREIEYEEVSDLLKIPEEKRIQPYPDYEEVFRYWVRAPYAYIAILKDDSQGDYRYYVQEPQLGDGEEELVLQEFNERLSTTLLFKHIDDDFEPEEELDEKVKVIEDEVLRLANEYDIQVDGETFHKLLYFIERDYVHYGDIDPLIRDSYVEDIGCVGDGRPLFVYHREYQDLLTNLSFAKKELRQFIIELAQRSGEHISAASPLLDASLPNGSRIQMSLGSEITTHGSTFTIRSFQEKPFTPIDLIHYGTFNLEQMAYIWLAIENDKSLIFAGGTASGKTTSMNAVSLFIPPKAKVVTIEDTREINLPHANWIPGVTREGFAGDEKGGVKMYNLLKAALRQRPEYMIVGEIRGDEATTLFQAMNTGHTTYSTMHADSLQGAIHRLENEPINVPRQMIHALDILCIQNQVRFVDSETGDVTNARRNQFIHEIFDSDGNMQEKTPFQYDVEMDEFRSNNLEESQVLNEIRKEQGLTHDEIHQELADRQAVLQYLVENEIRDVADVTRTIQAYMLNARPVLEAIEDDTLNPSEFKDITEVEFVDFAQKHPALETSAADYDSPTPSAESETGVEDESPDPITEYPDSINHGSDVGVESGDR